MYDSNVIMETILQRACAELHRNERAYWKSVQRQCDERTLKCVCEIEVYLQDRGINVEAIYKDNDDEETNVCINNIDNDNNNVINRENQSNNCEESTEKHIVINTNNKNYTSINTNVNCENNPISSSMKDTFNTTPTRKHYENAEKQKESNKCKIDDANRSDVILEPLVEHVSFRAQSNTHSSNHSAFTLPYAGTCTDDIVQSINYSSNINVQNNKIRFVNEHAKDEKCDEPLVECDPEQLLNAVEDFGPMLSSVTDTISTTERNGVNSSQEQISEQNKLTGRSHGIVDKKTNKPFPSEAQISEEEEEESESSSSQEWSEQQQQHHHHHYSYESTSPLLQLVSLEREEDEEEKNECKLTLKKKTNKDDKHNEGANECIKLHNNKKELVVKDNIVHSSDLDNTAPITSTMHDGIESTHSSELNSPHRSFSLHFTNPPIHHVERTSQNTHLNVPSTYTSTNSNAKTINESEELTIEHSVPENSSEMPWIGDQSHVTRTWSLHDTCQSAIKLPEVIDVSESALITTQDAETETNKTNHVQCNKQVVEENNNEKSPRGSAKLHDIMQSMERVLMRFTDERTEDNECEHKNSSNCNCNCDEVESEESIELNEGCNTKKCERRSEGSNCNESVMSQRKRQKPLKAHTESNNNNKHNHLNQIPCPFPSSSHSSPSEQQQQQQQQEQQESHSSYSSMCKEKLHQMVLQSREEPPRYREVLKRREVMSRMQTVLQNHHLGKLESANNNKEATLQRSIILDKERENAFVESANALVMSEDTREKVREVTTSLTNLIKLTSQIRSANEQKMKKKQNYKEKEQQMQRQPQQVTNVEFINNAHTGLINTSEAVKLAVPQRQHGNNYFVNNTANANVLKTGNIASNNKSITGKAKESNNDLMHNDKVNETATNKKDNRHMDSNTNLLEMIGYNDNSKSLCERLIAHNSYQEMAVVPEKAVKKTHELNCKAANSCEINNNNIEMTLTQNENDQRNCRRNGYHVIHLSNHENVSDLTSSLLSPSPRRPSTSL